MRLCAILIALGLSVTAPAFTQTPYYEFSVSDVTAAPDESRYFQAVDLTVLNSHYVQSWSLSVCHDSAVTDIRGVETTPFVLDLNLIGPLWFQAQSIVNRSMNVPGSSDGANQAVAIDQCSLFAFPDNSTHTVLRMEYLADPGTAGTTTATTVCQSVGNPNVAISLGHTQASGITVTPGMVTFVPNQPQWTLGGYDVAAHCPGGGAPCTVLVPIAIANAASNVTPEGVTL